MINTVKRVGATVLFSVILVGGFVSDVLAQQWAPGCGPNGPGCGGNSVPELDGAMGPLAMAILAGVIGIGLERRRRKDKTKI